MDLAEVREEGESSAVTQGHEEDAVVGQRGDASEDGRFYITAAFRLLF